MKVTYGPEHRIEIHWCNKGVAGRTPAQGATESVSNIVIFNELHGCDNFLRVCGETVSTIHFKLKRNFSLLKAIA